MFCRMCSVQFLVSKLVECCIPSKTKKFCDSTASQALSLLHMLTVDSDSSMYDYVKVSIQYSTGICGIKDLVCDNWEIYENNFLQELESFPELQIFDEIRKFHNELCHTYSIREHLMKVNKYHFPLHFYGCTTSSFKIILSCFLVLLLFSVCEEVLLPSTKVAFIKVASFSNRNSYVINFLVFNDYGLKLFFLKYN